MKFQSAKISMHCTSIVDSGGNSLVQFVTTCDNRVFNRGVFLNFFKYFFIPYFRKKATKEYFTTPYFRNKTLN